MTLILINVLLVICTGLGMYLIANHNKYGFLVFLVVEACMLYIGIMSSNYGLIVTAIIYVVMNIYSYYKWSYEK